MARTSKIQAKPIDAGDAALVYETSKWQRYLYDVRAQKGCLMDAADEIARAARPPSQPAGTGALTSEQADAYEAARASEQARTAVAGQHAHRTLGEVYARLYGEPDRLEVPATDPAWAVAAHEVLDALPEWQALRQSVAGDPDMAGLAAASVGAAIAAKVKELTESQPNPEQGTPGDGRAQARARAALRRAVAAAEGDVAKAREGLAGLAPGLESAPPTHEQVDPARQHLAERLAKDPKVQDVLRKAGRIARLAKDRRRVRDEHARSEVVDLERGGDVARILPSQLAGLSGPRRKLILRDIVERTALQYRLRGTEPLGRGPVIVLLDRSGSMQGQPERWASAAALAVMGAAGRERRRCSIVEFTYSPDTAVRIEGGKAVSLDVRTGEPNREPTSVVEVAYGLASRSSNGGTSFGPVLKLAMKLGVRDDRADFVFVTDGQADADAATMADLLDAKARGLRVWGLTVAGGSISRSLAAICDATVDLDRCADVGEAIAQAMPA